MNLEIKQSTTEEIKAQILPTSTYILTHTHPALPSILPSVVITSFPFLLPYLLSYKVTFDLSTAIPLPSRSPCLFISSCASRLSTESELVIVVIVVIFIIPTMTSIESLVSDVSPLSVPLLLSLSYSFLSPVSRSRFPFLRSRFLFPITSF